MLFRKFSFALFKRKFSARTSLYQFHIENEAKIVPFAGYSMPLLYGNRGIIETSKHVRNSAGLFDVSHMLQILIDGPGAIDFMETLTVADLRSLKPGNGVLSSYLNESGGILDDTILNKVSNTKLYLVSNAGCAMKIKNHLSSMKERLKPDLRIEFLHKSLLALQGPKAAEVLSRGLSDSSALQNLYFMQTFTTEELFGIRGDPSENGSIRITRCGYTGEDGFEISIPDSSARSLAEALAAQKEVGLIGLGARDVLRLEAGMCLYGNDIDESSNPVEASLLWTISKSRRSEIRSPNFLGWKEVMNSIKCQKSLNKKRVGLLWKGGPQARKGTPVLSEDGTEIGVVTSGCYSPTLDCLIAMAYVPAHMSKIGQSIFVQIRGKNYKRMSVYRFKSSARTYSRVD